MKIGSCKMYSSYNILNIIFYFLQTWGFFFIQDLDGKRNPKFEFLFFFLILFNIINHLFAIIFNSFDKLFDSFSLIKRSLTR